MKEIVVESENAQIDESSIVNSTKVEKVENKSQKSKNKTIVKGLRFSNVSVQYIDGIGERKVMTIDLEMPLVEKEWYSSMARKALSLYCEENNIFVDRVVVVALPSNGGKEFDMEVEFLDKPFKDFTKKDVVNAAIYYRLRTVYSAKGYDESEMRVSLWNHLCEDKNYDEDAKISDIK